MATLTSDELAEIRHEVARLADGSVQWTKPQINSVFQAIENWWETPATKAAASAAIDAALPGLTNAQKKRAVGVWLRQKARREGA